MGVPTEKAEYAVGAAMSDQCPTCGSHDPLYELVSVKERTARIAMVVLRCPDTWHFATDATPPNVEHSLRCPVSSPAGATCALDASHSGAHSNGNFLWGNGS